MWNKTKQKIPENLEILRLLTDGRFENLHKI